MIHYRKSGSREFYRLDQENATTTRVIHKRLSSKIEVASIFLIGLDDIDHSQPSTEEEFTSAYKEALERITTGKI